jgi:Amt family ammonium transporter
MCGVWGALATGVFASPAITEGAKGLVFGNPKQLWIQAISIVGTAGYTAIATFIIIHITRFITGGLRVDEENEILGLDNTIHGERAFEID